MASPRCLLRPLREVSFRVRPQISRRQLLPVVQSRFASSDPKISQVPPGTKGPNEDQLPHVSEEQAAVDKSMGNTPPDIDQGTPVKEILKDDKKALDNAPQVIKDQVKNSQSGIGQKRSYSTSARRMDALAQVPQEQEQVIQNGMIVGMEYPDAGPGHKFPLPDVNDLPSLSHLRRRYDPVLEQLTKAIMRHGKLSVAQKITTQILDTLRTSPAPNINPAYPARTLMLSDTAGLTSTAMAQQQSPFAPPPINPNSHRAITSIPRSALPLHPIEYLTTIIDSVAPLVKIRQQRGMAGGGASTPIPVPLGVRQRRRQAIQWILDVADKRRETNLADRVAKELVKVAEGQSSVWERRAMVHRLGVSARSNVRNSMMRRRK